MDFTKNLGVIIEPPAPEDWIGGAITFEPRCTIRDWRQFNSTNEAQAYKYFDPFDCVTVSELASWESQANFFLFNNLWPADALKFWNDKGYIVNGKFETSSRFTAKMSGTVPGRGNSNKRVQESIRKDGVVPRSVYTGNDSMTEADYYSEVPEAVKLLGKESLKYFNWLYESLTDLSPKNLAKQLEHAPVNLIIFTCSPWSDRVPACSTEPNHQILLNHVEEINNSFDIKDQYDPFDKKLLPGYKIWSASKGVLYPVKRMEPVVSSFNKDIVFGDSGSEVAKLKSVLHKLGWLSDDVLVMPDIYEENLADAVYRFQLSNLSRTFWEMVTNLKGKRVGPATRAVLNSYIK